MAIIKPSAIIQSITGALGSLVFARNRGQQIVRVNPSRVQVSSAKAQTQRATQSLAAAAWRKLTDAQRQTWVNFCRGQTMTTPGGVTLPLDPRLAFFQQFVFQYLESGAQITSVPPLTSIVQWRKPTLVVLPGGPAYVQQDPNQGAPWSHYVLHAQRTFKTYPAKPAPNYKVVARPVSRSQDISVTAGLTAALGYPQPGEYVAWQLEQWYPSVWGSLVTKGVTQVPRLGLERVINGTFEADTPGALPANWTTTPTGAFFATQYAYGMDTNAAQWYAVAPAGGSNIRAFLSGSFVAGRTYRLSFMIEPWTGGFTQIYVAGGGGGNLIITNSYSMPPQEWWGSSSFDFVMDVNRVDPWVRFAYYSTTNCTVNFDHVSVREVL